MSPSRPTAPRLSARISDLHPSPIREILAVAQQPGMISFAGGLPAAETFPDLGLTVAAEALQYGPSEGDWALRCQVAEELAGLGLTCPPEQVLILSGSQQGIDLVGKLFVDAGTPVAVEAPTYLATLQVFRLFGAQFLPYSVQQIQAADWLHQRPALAYAIPTFQNPTGHCYSLAEREALAAACVESGTPLFEDDPYRDLVYSPCERRPVCALLQDQPASRPGVSGPAGGDGLIQHQSDQAGRTDTRSLPSAGSRRRSRPCGNCGPGASSRTRHPSSQPSDRHTSGLCLPN